MSRVKTIICFSGLVTTSKESQKVNRGDTEGNRDSTRIREPSVRERLEALDLPSLGDRRVRNNVIIMFKFLKHQVHGQ